MHGFWRAALYAAALGILAHPVGQALPRRWFDPHRTPYRCRDWEQGGRVYNKLHIRRWKDRLPDMSRLMPDMVKKKLAAADPMSLVWRPAWPSASTAGWWCCPWVCFFCGKACGHGRCGWYTTCWATSASS